MEKVRYLSAPICLTVAKSPFSIASLNLSLLSVIDIPLLLDVCKKVKNTSLLIPIPKARRTIEPCQANLCSSGKFIYTHLVR